MKRLILIGAALFAAPVLLLAQDSRVEVSGSIAAGGRTVDDDTGSSKLTEYRDVDDQALVPRLTLDVFDPGNGRYLEIRGTDVSLENRRLGARAGAFGTWSLAADWTGLPHNRSNKAQTPYTRNGGLFEVGSNVPITFKRLATGAPDAPSVLAQDALIAAWQQGALVPTPLATDGSLGRVSFGFQGVDRLALGATYERRAKDGLKVGYGPIGDRPPRTLNIELPEPVDHLTQDMTLSADWTGRKAQAQLSYQYSDFANGIDTFTWENVYATQGASSDPWDRAVSTFGRRPLAPDNRYHNFSGSFGLELPRDSHLSATLAYGRLEQDQALLPYSFNSDLLANATLPRATADAKMTTRQVLVDYVIAPSSRLDLRAYARYAGLDNETPEARWQYVTSDTANLNGTVSFKNQRINLAYAWDRMNAGTEATFRLGGAWHSSLAVGYEYDGIDRDHREADTGEHRLTASFRARPARGVRLRTRYTLASRNGDYDPFVTRASYWYDPARADGDNPMLSFSNHPDMVRFDVADRRRQRGDVALTLSPKDAWSLTASLRYVSDDFDSDVQPVQALAGSGVGEVGATSPGDQLGLLERDRLRLGLDGFYTPADRVSLNAFVSWDRGTSLQRSLEFNENNKTNPSAVATAALGPWTRASSEWTADFDDTTRTAGVGTNLRIRDGWNLSASYTVSLGEIDLGYSGFGVTNWDGTPFPANHEFQFPARPPTINSDQHVFDMRLDIPVVERVTATVGYGYEKYRTDDWQQGSSFSWVEEVGSEFLLRDSSRSHQWGNRLFNLGTFLAPSYDAHIAWAAFTYRF
jgi:MtrB/PioB family decaheme-associated outer membrane protein